MGLRDSLQVAGAAAAACGLTACLAPAQTAPVVIPTLPPLSALPVTAQTVAPIPSVPPATSPAPSLPAVATAILPVDPAPAVQAAIRLVATELMLPPEDIVLISALPVQWQDASLGCPLPGQTYPQVVTDGFMVTLAAGDATYSVHTDRTGTAVLCRDETVVGGAISDPLVLEFIEQARTELAAQRGIDPAEIALARSEAVDWSDSSLGCALPGAAYQQVITPGYRIVLVIGEERFEYHTDQQRMFLCAAPTQ